MTPRSPLPIAAALALVLAGAAQAESPDVAFGRRLAQRDCAACHAVGAGPSPNPASPPFRDLWRRYRPGELDVLLSEGMLATQDQVEEGRARVHPRMPRTVVGDDELAALRAYLHSLDPRRHRRRR